MKKTFRNLQNQHPSVRARVALTIATTVTVVIALILLTTLPLRFQDTSLAGGSENAAAVANATAPYMQNLEDSWQNISGFEVNQGADTQSSADSTQVPTQDLSQDYGYPEDSAQVGQEETY